MAGGGAALAQAGPAGAQARVARDGTGAGEWRTARGVRAAGERGKGAVVVVGDGVRPGGVARLWAQGSPSSGSSAMRGRGELVFGVVNR